MIKRIISLESKIILWQKKEEMKRFELEKLKCESVGNEIPRLDLEAESNRIKDLLWEYHSEQCKCHVPLKFISPNKSIT